MALAVAVDHCSSLLKQTPPFLRGQRKKQCSRCLNSPGAQRLHLRLERRQLPCAQCAFRIGSLSHLRDRRRTLRSQLRQLTSRSLRRFGKPLKREKALFLTGEKEGPHSAGIQTHLRKALRLFRILGGLHEQPFCFRSLAGRLGTLRSQLFIPGDKPRQRLLCLASQLQAEQREH